VTQQSKAKPAQRMGEDRVVRMNPKVDMWAVLCASLIGVMSFSLLFIHAAYRNNWW